MTTRMDISICVDVEILLEEMNAQKPEPAKFDQGVWRNLSPNARLQLDNLIAGGGFQVRRTRFKLRS